jgi:hypothetical protein
MASYFNVLTTTGVNASSSGSGYYPLGIQARYVMVQNYSNVPIWVRFDACSTVATTGDIVITACENARTKSFLFGDSFSFASKVTVFATSTVAAQFSIYASDGTTISQ